MKRLLHDYGWLVLPVVGIPLFALLARLQDGPETGFSDRARESTCSVDENDFANSGSVKTNEIVSFVLPAPGRQ